MFKGFLYYGNYTDSIGLIRIDKELSISNSTNIGEVSGGENTGGVVGGLENYVNSAGTKLYSHNSSFNIISCSNKRAIAGSGGDGGVMGSINSTLSYMGISGDDAEEVSKTVINELIIKYCFNTGSISGAINKGGIVGTINNYMGLNGTVRGGKFFLSISYNYSTGNLTNTTNNSINGIIGAYFNYIYSSNCFTDQNVLNNFNTGAVKNGGTIAGASGVVGYVSFSDNNANSPNVNLHIENNYNYSTNISGGEKQNLGGVVEAFVANCSRVMLLNNYSAYKREGDNNIHGRNPTTNGANVGEEIKMS